jgi:Uma2 family endonuclease
MTNPTRMSAAEYFLGPESNLMNDLIDGVLIFRGTNTPAHQFVLGDLAIYLHELVPNGRVWLSPLDVHLDDYTVVQPDLFWVAENSRCHESAGRERFENAPDLVIELLMEGWIRHDRIVKFGVYQRFGAPEYWIVDPLNQYVEVYCLVDGKYIQQGIYEATDSFSSPVLGGKTVELSRIFKD